VQLEVLVVLNEDLKRVTLLHYDIRKAETVTLRSKRRAI
jgi:hypothetical protein